MLNSLDRGQFPRQPITLDVTVQQKMVLSVLLNNHFRTIFAFVILSFVIQLNTGAVTTMTMSRTICLTHS